MISKAAYSTSNEQDFLLLYISVSNWYCQCFGFFFDVYSSFLHNCLNLEAPLPHEKWGVSRRWNAI